MQKLSLSPFLFSLLLTIILSPSFLLLAGVVIYIFLKNEILYSIVISGSIFQLIGIVVVSPLAGGILSYGYLERYKAKGWSAVVAKITLAYSVIFLGIFVMYFISALFS